MIIFISVGLVRKAWLRAQVFDEFGAHTHDAV